MFYLALLTVIIMVVGLLLSNLYGNILLFLGIILLFICIKKHRQKPHTITGYLISLSALILLVAIIIRIISFALPGL